MSISSKNYILNLKKSWLKSRIKSNRFVYSSLMNYSQSQKWVCQDASLGARPQAPGKVAALQRSTASCEAGQRNYSAPLQMLGIHHFLFLRVIH